MDTAFKVAGSALFADPNMTEAVLCTPAGQASFARRAIVDRRPAPQADGPPGMKRLDNVIHLSFANDPDVGLTSVKPGFFTVTLPWRVGDTPTELVVTKVLAVDEMGWKLEATK